MKAAIYERFAGPITVENVPDPAPQDDGVVIKVEATGLCRSDWHGWQGHDDDIRLPHVPGHEFAGTIAALGKDVRGWSVGDRVAVPFVCACGRCSQCASGNQQVCDHQSQPGFTHWGSFAEFVRVDRAAVNLVPLPESVDFVTAASLGCRFATSFRAIVHQGRVRAGEWVAIHGCGGIGLSAVMIARALGAQVIAIDIDEAKLALAREVGAVATVNAGAVADVPEAVRALSGGGVHVSMDALGSPVTCFNSIANLRKRGRHLQVGLMLGEHKTPAIPMAQVIAQELEILGCHGMQAHAYPALLGMMEQGLIHPQRLIGQRVTLAEGAQILMEMAHFPTTGVAVIERF
jgi:alcohol dehydrogenase